MAFKPFKTLLFGFAFSPSLKANVYEATRLANYFEAALILLHVGEKTKEKENPGTVLPLSSLFLRFIQCIFEKM